MLAISPAEKLIDALELPYSEKLVARPVVPMFAAPDPLAEHISQALLGMTVSELGGRGEWRLVRTWDGYQGWLATAGLADFPTDWGGPWAEVTDLCINLRQKASFKLAAASQAIIGTRLPLTAREEGWVQMLLPDNRRLWTEAHRVAELTDQPLRAATARAVAGTARRFLNVPYLWGGCSTVGLDCSGFAQLVMRLHGIALPRDAHQQAEGGRPSAEPDIADLVFFGPAGLPEKITHVGLMLDRERFIHAAGSDKVRINRLADATYDGQFRFARRYLEPPSGRAGD